MSASDDYGRHAHAYSFDTVDVGWLLDANGIRLTERNGEHRADVYRDMRDSVDYGKHSARTVIHGGIYVGRYRTRLTLVDVIGGNR